MIRALIDSWQAILTVPLREIEKGVSLIDAVAADEFETALRLVTTTDAERDDIRHTALMVAQLGYTADETEQALIEFRRHGYRTDYELASIEHYVAERRKNLRP
jgi:hypothetical protein